MKKAYFVRDIAEWRSDAKLFRLSEPMADYKWHDDPVKEYEIVSAVVADDPVKEYEYVIVSAVVADYSGAETYIFPADAEGNAESMFELPGSQRGTLSHVKVLNDAGYTVVDE